MYSRFITMRTKYKEIRMRMGLSQFQFAMKIGVSMASVSGFESGRYSKFSPRIKTKLADGYGVPLEEINAACSKEQAAA